MTDAPAAPRRITVAIVDDDASVRIGLRRLCEVFGLSVTTYGSGHEFLAALTGEESRPDCLLLDAQMPEMNGSELLRHLIARGVHVPTIVCTADDTLEVRARYAAPGFVVYLQKPLGAERLLEAIGQALRHRDATP